MLLNVTSLERSGEAGADFANTDRPPGFAEISGRSELYDQSPIDLFAPEPDDPQLGSISPKSPLTGTIGNDLIAYRGTVRAITDEYTVPWVQGKPSSALDFFCRGMGNRAESDQVTLFVAMVIAISVEKT